MMEWEYKGNFLEQFEAARRSYITNIFCYAYRGGNWIEQPKAAPAKDLTEMLERIRNYCDARLAEPHITHNRGILEALLLLVGDPEAKEFARHIAKREQLSQADKDRLKTEAQKQFVSKAMQIKPPSEKQVAYLKKLGCSTVPASMQEASELIEQFKRAA